MSIGKKVALSEEVSARFLNRSKWKEAEDLEFKLAATKVPDDMWETYSSFANSEGGIIVLGVENNGTVHGVQNAPKMLSNIATLLNNSEKVSQNLLQSGMLADFELNGKVVIALKVPKASREQKPVYVGGNTRNTFLRLNESDVRCSNEQVQQMLRDKVNEPVTSQLMPRTSWECIDIASWRGYRNRMQSYKPDHPWVELDDITLLERLGGYVRNEEDNVGGLTLAGLLMFGTDIAIEKHFPRYHVDYFEYDSSNGDLSVQNWVERIYPDGTWVCNIYQFFFRLLPKLTESFKKPFQLNPDLTAQGETNQHKAIREALANALVHADYYGDGGIVIRQYPDRTELTNPGTLLIPQEKMMQGGVSICRNPALQKMFQRIGVVDKAGSGVDTIFKGWMERSLMPPKVHVSSHPYQVKWVLPYMSIIPKEAEQQLKSVIGPSKYETLNLIQRTLLLIISAREKAGHKEIRELYPYIHPADLTKLLAGLEQMGCLQAEGKTSSKQYKIAANIEPKQKEDSDIHYSECVREVRKSKKTSREKIKQAILSLADGKWVTIHELKTILNRQPRTLQIAIEILVDTKKLELQYPEETRHPKQAYRALS